MSKDVNEYKAMAKSIKKEEAVEERQLTNEVAIKDLKEQLNHYQNMILKTQGALEVLEQIEKAKAKV
tara:strand:+ start:66 stop:266 length:201 start_codon:yes stop_codon:yes gene_type:complete